MAAYTLTRTLPDGTVKAHTMTFPRVRDAASAAGRVLADNRAATKADAQRFAAALSRTTVGTELPHEPSGYRFRIDPAS